MTQPIDMNLFVFINQIYRKEWLDFLMPLLSSPAFFVAMIAVAASIGVYKKGSKYLVVMLLVVSCMGLTDLTTNCLKKAVGRVRPLNSVALTFHHENGKWQRRPEDFKRTKERGNSFPSGHSSNSMAFVVILMLLSKRFRPWLFLIPLSVGYSRIYLGKHFPADVIAGWFVGLCVAFAVWLFWEYVLKGKMPVIYRT